LGVPSASLLREPALYWAIGVLSLLSGASFVYASIKAPYFWGVLYIPGIVLLNVFALSAIAGAMVALQRRKRPQ
jgi:hypothetical protein